MFLLNVFEEKGEKMKKIIVLLIALIAVIGCSSLVSAGLFDFGSDNGPIGADIINSTIIWETESIVTGVEGGETTSMGLTRFSIDENGHTDATFNTSDVNNVNGTLKIKLTNASESQIKELKDLQGNIGINLDVKVNDSQFKDPIHFYADEFGFDGQVLHTAFSSEHLDLIADGEGSAQITSGNITIIKSNGDEINIVF